MANQGSDNVCLSALPSSRLAPVLELKGGKQLQIFLTLSRSSKNLFLVTQVLASALVKPDGLIGLGQR